MAIAQAPLVRARLRVTGTVQGVGFRPHVFRLAEASGLAGWVLNDEHGVLAEVEGDSGAVDEFARRLATDAPPLATVEGIELTAVAPTGEHGFRIVDSPAAGEADAPVAADSASCEECLAEIADPGNRRYRYPFTNCTNCGPRFTIIRGVPYDRPLTTMAGFEMCTACRAEYEDPRDRRFHAQPNACPACGPSLRLLGATGDGEPLAETVAMLRSGGIVAIKGLGGYHLACDAANDEAVAALRSRKHREDKPFALMAPDLESARELVALSLAEEQLLTGRERPIVIARRQPGARVAAPVAPRSADLGVMLPYTPLHHLLLGDFAAPLVMTSANVSDEPIAYLDEDARERLAAIADAFLVHDRPIHMRTDDSVVRALDERLGAPLVIRRSRGWVPESISIAPGGPAVLGCGAELKSTFCLAKGGRAWVGHHIGDLKNWETLRSFREGVEHFERVFAVAPALVAHDLHPDYLSTRYGLEREGVETIAVQHHHAHLAACLAEHGHEGAAVGAIFDGSGFGPDGTVWGGELLVGDASGFERAGLLFPVRLPGGDAAVKEPWRMAASWLAGAFEEDRPRLPSGLDPDVAPSDWDVVCGLATGGAGSPLTTSAGRLFDAVAALCGIRARVNHEGQAAAELEGLAARDERGRYPLAVIGDGAGDPWILDPRETIRAIVEDLGSGTGADVVGARFHNALAHATASACARIAELHGLDTVVLSGGVFQNRLLVEATEHGLRGHGLRVLVPQKLPPNDGGISYGQVAVARALTAGTKEER